MLEIIKKAYSTEILNQALERFELDTGPAPQNLKGFESYVFACHHQGQERVLKLYHRAHRKAEQIEAEWQWVKDLKAMGIGVPQVYPSAQGRIVEMLSQGFYAVLSEKLPGRELKKEDKNTAYYQRLGDLLGRLHLASESLKTPTQRPQWSESPLLDLARWIPEEETEIREAGFRTLQQLRALPQSPENYGLIHGDIHSGNLLLDGKQLWLFDFDDCEYHWFANDIAVALYYLLPPMKLGLNDAAFAAAAQQALRALLPAYRAHRELSPQSLQQLPLFLRLREVVLYALVHRVDELKDKLQNTLALRKQLILDPRFETHWSHILSHFR